MYNLLSGYAIDAFLPIAKWLSIGFASALIIAILIVCLTQKQNAKNTVKKLFLVLFAFLLALGLTCLIMEIAKKYSVSYAEENWLDRTALLKFVLIPVCVLTASIVISATALFLISKKNNDNGTVLKKWIRILGTINLVILVAVGVLMAIYYNQKISNDGYYNSESAAVNQPMLYILAGLLIVVLIAVAFIFDKNSKPLDTRCLATAGITVAMSFGLSYIKLFEMPQGGSITLVSLLPIMIFSYLYGTKKGVFVCFVYGILQAIQDPWLIHPAQFLLDYPVAFAAIGLTGLFNGNKKLQNYPQISFIAGGIIASIARFLSHVLSGVFAFAVYAGDGNVWAYSLGYNSFVFIDIAITLVVGALVFSSKSFLNEMQKRIGS